MRPGSDAEKQKGAEEAKEQPGRPPQQKHDAGVPQQGMQVALHQGLYEIEARGMDLEPPATERRKGEAAPGPRRNSVGSKGKQGDEQEQSAYGA